MNSANRRGFLKVAGAGAVAAGAVTLAPTTALAGQATKAGTSERAETLPAEAQGSMVAYVHDVSTGEVAVMIEGQEVTVTDHQLVAKLATAFHSAPSTSL